MSTFLVSIAETTSFTRPVDLRSSLRGVNVVSAASSFEYSSVNHDSVGAASDVEALAGTVYLGSFPVAQSRKTMRAEAATSRAPAYAMSDVDHHGSKGVATHLFDVALHTG